jgi:hypothetical protein
MKLHLLFFSLLILVASVTSSHAGTKRALIIAIGDYPREGGWPAISSVKDTTYIKATLRKQGFSESNIKVIIDEQATKKGINDAFKALISESQKGDIVVIHFSSHGEQVEDDNGDEADGLDECVVSYDAIAPNQDGFTENLQKDGAGYFRDDALGDYINKLRVKLGKEGDVLVFMDNCHSGTGTRGVAKVRGGKPPLVSRSFDPNKYKSDDASGNNEGNANVGDENNMATYVVFSAARAEEFDYETTDDVTHEGVGSLSYAISKAFENLDANTTYRGLFAKVQAIMNDKVPSQHPVLEGTGLDRTLFAGKFVQQKPYVEIDKILDSKQIKIKAGVMAGLDIGAKVAIYPSNTIDPKTSTPIALGIVTNALNYFATVNLDKALTIKQPAEGWVFVTDPVYKVNPIVLGISNNKSRGTAFTQSDITTIENGLKDIPIVKFEGNPELLLVHGIKDSIINVENGYCFATINNVPANTQALADKMEEYAQYKFLQRLNAKEPGIDIDVQFVPIINGKPDMTKMDSKKVGDMYEFTENDTVVLYVKNKGEKNVFINILDMQPDGIINPVLPNTKISPPMVPSELKVEAGKDRIFSNYRLYFFPPYGTELYKIFASTSEINMEQLATTRGQETRGNFSGLEKLVKKSYGMRGSAGSIETGNADGSTYDLLFRIKPGRLP